MPVEKRFFAGIFLCKNKIQKILKISSLLEGIG